MTNTAAFWKRDPETDAVEAFNASRAVWNDYQRGRKLGWAGAPDPMGHANYATWQGWRDAGAESGRLPYLNVFARKPTLRIVE